MLLMFSLSSISQFKFIIQIEYIIIHRNPTFFFVFLLYYGLVSFFSESATTYAAFP